MASIKERSLVRISAYVLSAFCALSALSASSVILLSKSHLDESARYTRNVISRNIQTGGLPYALITGDRESLRSIADAQLAYREVHAISIEDGTGRTLYQSNTLSDRSDELETETIKISDTREPVAIDDIEKLDEDPVLGYVTITFTRAHAQNMVARMVATSAAISVTTVLIFVLILGAFNRSIRNYVSHVMGSLQRLRSGEVLTAKGDIRVVEFKQINDHIVEASLYLSDKESSLREAYESEREAKKESERAAKFRDEIIKSVSHDLRTPVTVIDGLLRIVEKSIMDSNVDETTKRNVELCISSSNLLKDIVEEIFNFDQFYKSRLQNNPKAVDVAKLVYPLKSIYDNKCKHKRIGFYCHMPTPGGTTYNVDAGKLTRIIENLLENAVKFTNRGSVNLTVLLKQDEIVVTVSDTGIGIPEDRIKDIFVEYIQVARPESRATGGRGLGLSYVHAMCSAMDAQIDVQSLVGVGSKFTVTIPAAATTDAVTREAPALDLANSNLSCLVIDDKLEVCHLMKTLLEGFGVAAATECIPELGLLAVKKSLPDIVFVDYHMPDLDGFTLSKMVRNESITKSITLVAITADAHPETRLKLSETFDFVLTKPIDERQLQDVLQAKCLAQRTIENITDRGQMDY